MGRKIKDFYIGDVLISPPVALAPMAGVTDRAFREIVSGMGCGLVYTEMISARALVYNNQKTLDMLDIEERKVPVAVQIFGSEPEIMAEAAAMVEDICRPEIIDINMGCPTPKIVKNGDGAALLKDPARAAEIVKMVSRRIRIPVTVKIRKGWDNPLQGLNTARMCQEAGARAIAIHGRTREEFYSGKADREFIARVKKELKIQVLGNGDIYEPEDALEMFRITGCDGVLVGRGARGNPWIFARIKSLLEGRETPPPEPGQRIEVLKRHLIRSCELKGEKTGVKEMRKHFSWYLKNLYGSRQIKQEIFQTDSLQEIISILDSYAALLRQREV